MPAPKGHPPYNKNGEGGKPRTWDREVEADALEEWIQQPDNIFVGKFALSRGYHPDRLAEWAKESERFARALKQAKKHQEFKLAESGMYGKSNPGFTKFVMANVCDWYEKQQTVVQGDQANPLTFVLSNTDNSSQELVQGAE